MNNEDRLIAQLKAQYNAQPLPPTLEERICDSMKKDCMKNSKTTAPGAASSGGYTGAWGQRRPPWG